MDRYGSEIIGIGFDSELGMTGDDRWKGKLDLKRLKQTIQLRAPHLWMCSLLAYWLSFFYRQTDQKVSS